MNKLTVWLSRGFVTILLFSVFDFALYGQKADTLSIFPFVGKPMIQFVMQLDELQFRNIMLQRKKEIPKFIIDSIKKWILYE